jgi:hypothetical protein
MARAWAVFVLAVFVTGPALANDFVARTAGAATIIAIDRDSLHRIGRLRTGWSYELYRERNPLTGRRPQITAILELVDCQTLFARRLKVVQYREDATVLARFGPERAWTETLRGSNTEMIRRAMCEGPGPAWARRKASTVFDLYRQAWR